MKTANVLSRCAIAAAVVLFALGSISAEAGLKFVHQPASSAPSTSPAAAPSPAQSSPVSQPPGSGGSQAGQAGTQNTSQATGHPGAAGSDGQVKAQTPETIVRDVYLFGHEEAADKERGSAAIDDIIVAKVEALQSLVNQSHCLDDTNKKLLNCIERPLALFLDGREMKSITPEAVDVNAGTVHFHLHRNRDNDEAWADLLGAPPLDHHFFKRPSKVSVGLQDGSPVMTAISGFLLERIDKGWFVAGCIIIVLLIFSLFKLARKSDLLRASGPHPVDADGKPLAKAFSLARFQMAFWFMLVVAAYCFIWLITGASDTITGSVLALIGIGSGTALGAAMVDVSKGQPAPASEGFLKDVLSDADGICFHRFQMFVWTLVLGMMFVSSVYYNLSMPDFNATLLGLQGISAGTYLGFKIPEKQG